MRASASAARTQRQADVFAALGERTRLSLVSKLIDGEPHSISTLSDGAKISRQAITKHLSVLESVGLVSSFKRGRESLYALNPKPLQEIREYLAVIEAEWGQALNRLKFFVEKS